MVNPIEADYVVVGAGAMGMAFVDEILSFSDATVAIIDQHAKPGGHWNDAYPYVRLHQPSFFYGVSSTRLGSDRLDEVGLNAGLSELASGAEVCAYYDQLMQRRFLPSGQVQYFPRTVFRAGEATTIPSGETRPVTAHRAVVDATYMKVKVPSTSPPAYGVDRAASVIPPNRLPAVDRPPGGYNVIGAGKTAFDAIVWLLGNGVDPDDIQWIVPRDSWLLDRAATQPHDFRISEQTRIIAESSSAADLYERLEAEGLFLRIDPSIEPTMYRCATVTEAELAELRRVRRVVRGSRVAAVGPASLELDNGAVIPAEGMLHIDCTADGLERLPAQAVFGESLITLQTLRPCQQVFSAGLTGRLETLNDLDRDQKNALASVIPHPDTPHDFLTGALAHLHGVGRWLAEPAVAAWLQDSRLSPSGGRPPNLDIAVQAVGNLERFIESATSS